MDLVHQLQNILDDSVASGEECGCQLTVFRHGKLLCDLCAGYTTAEQNQRVDLETLFPVFSVGKGIVTTLFHRLVERGLISYDDPVIKYWQEYACQGKENTLIRHVLSHRAGLFNVPPQLSFEEWFDWNKFVPALATATPADAIGGISHYHAHTFGVLVGRIAELATGKKFQQLLEEEILKPLQLSALFFGLPQEKFTNLASIDGSRHWNWCVNFNQTAVLKGLNPSSNGCTNAHSIAKLYASLLEGGVDGVQLLKPETVEQATILSQDILPAVRPDDWGKFGLGYVLCGPDGNLGRMFGHGGALGSEGFADKETGYAVGFTKNRITPLHPNHATRNAISKVLELPERIW